ncbi:MAG: coenzyme transferase [Firmicutes bacterium]|nr:coenzyme transferase [Bacillota bacterium]
MAKVITADEAAAIIKDGSTVLWTTAGLCGFAEEIAMAVEKRFLETGYPRQITAVHDCGCGEGKIKGMNRLGYEGLVKRIISGHIGQAPRMGQLILENKVEAYLMPQGVLAHLWRQIAGKKPGVITKVGMGTYVDPRLEGGKGNAKTTEDLVKVIELEGEEWLMFKKFPVDMAIIRGTTADEKGNLTMEKEALFLESLPMAQAVKNSGGIVIAQVEYLAKAGTMHPKQVKVPGVLVDYVVVAKPENHMQTMGTYFNPALSGDVKMPLASLQPLPFDARKIVARRAAMELMPNTIINLGIGMPDGVGSIAAEEGITELLTLTTELGTYGGMPASGADFATAYNAEAIIEHEAQFDFYDGGGLDTCFLGLAQTDKNGNLNVSKFGAKMVGAGGFINISQNAKKVVFCGTFTNGAEISLEGGQVTILKEGKNKKFIDKIDQVTFSGHYAQQTNQPVLYVTERAVFTLEDGELTLIEIAPGVDLEKDILGAMEFKPRISQNLKEMPPAIFRPEWGQLKEFIEAKSPNAS